MTELQGTPRWVFIERASSDPRFPPHGPDLYIGPFKGPDADGDATRCMEDSVLVEGFLQPAGGGGTDCYVTTDQPGPDDETWIVDLSDPAQTGREHPCKDDDGRVLYTIWEGQAE